ncbi:MAG: hypothetical protein BEN18_00945 [Epulopiscium sp. Nuni2H_MBin001]|nr:MAG: hypothetical protein BEN18_00945 [Epulopiscium sp. Nuni2H_MBin001]
MKKQHVIKLAVIAVAGLVPIYCPPANTTPLTIITDTTTPIVSCSAQLDTDNQFSKTIMLQAAKPSGEEIITPINIKWDDGWFDVPATKYNAELAIASVALSGSTYLGDAPLTEFGFSDIKTYDSYKSTSMEDNHSVAYTFGKKDTDTGTIVAVVIRGTCTYEWYSNFEIGQEINHKGFDIAAAQLKDNLLEYIEDLDDVKILFTGHSRGGGVANLLAAEFSESMLAEDIYAYTFASPNVSLQVKPYENIFNIINPQDFVTKVPLGVWGYSRNGIDLLLPSRSYYGEYDDLFGVTRKQFFDLTGEDFSVLEDHGIISVDSLVDDIYSLSPSVWHYYNSRQNANFPTMFECMEMLANYLVTDNVRPMLDATIKYHSYIGGVFNKLSNARVILTHSPITYYSWMVALEDDISTSASFDRVVISSPVDVYVYDEYENLVASIVDETIVENTLAVYVADGVKTIDLPSSNQYKVKVVAYNKGSMEYTVHSMTATAAQSIVEDTVILEGIKIEKGDIVNVSDTSFIVDDKLASQPI